MKSKVDFMNENTTGALIKLFIPLMLAMTLTMAYSMVDSLWVGNLLGEAGMSALTASTAIVLIMNSLSMGVGNEVSVMIAQRVGAKDTVGVKRAAAVVMISGAWHESYHGCDRTFLSSLMGLCYYQFANR